MAMWKLSTEDKDKLMAESEAKHEELKVLQVKKWSDLWEEDLETFLRIYNDLNTVKLSSLKRRDKVITV
jgi:hypothetical protein